MPEIISKYVDTVTVVDPDSNGEVEVEIRKTVTGLMVGLDGCFLEQSDDNPFSPYDANATLIIPDDEEKSVTKQESLPRRIAEYLINIEFEDLQQAERQILELLLENGYVSKGECYFVLTDKM